MLGESSLKVRLALELGGLRWFSKQKFLLGLECMFHFEPALDDRQKGVAIIRVDYHVRRHL
jgi:hypothetical protein